MNAPLALFVYNRPFHTRKTLESIAACELARETDLYIFADGIKPGTSDENINAIEEVRKIIRERNWCRITEIRESTINNGLANSIIGGVTDLVNRFGKIIVVEDDMELSPYFLKFMNEGLELYENDEEVISLTGFTWPVAKELPEIFFLRGTYCWGWATWKRGWELFEADGEKLLTELEERKLTALFDFDSSHHYTEMLRDQIAGKSDSWALRWYAAAFLKNKLTLIPGRSLVQNIGIDGSGRHSGKSNDWTVKLAHSPVAVKRIPLVDSKEGRKLVAAFFRKLKRKKSLVGRVERRIINIFQPRESR